jgi:hypothetical protein
MSVKSQFIVRRSNRGLGQGPVLGVSQDQVNFSSSGDQTLVVAVTSRIIKVHKLLIVGAGATDIRLYSGPSSEADPITGSMNFAGGFSIALDDDDFMILCESGKALVLNSSNAVQVGGIIVYSIY